MTSDGIPSGRGIGSTAPAIGGSPTIAIGIRAGTLGLPPADALLVAASPQPPELVAEQEVEIGPDGTVKVEIDTGVAKAIHPDQDHSYTITAEVVDRRGGRSSARARCSSPEPFTVYAWLDRGYYGVGDTIHAHFSARTLDGKPVEGKGELTLLQISYKDGKPVETPVQTWPLDTNADGIAQQQITASQAGQYRLSYNGVASQGKGERGEGERRSHKGRTITQISKSPNQQIPNPSSNSPHL